MAGRGQALRDLLLIFAGGALVFGVGLGARDLWHPNEPTYGRAVAEMASDGVWVMPTVNGLAFAEKPILYFWMARIAAVLRGSVDEFALRVPSLISALALLATAYVLVRGATTRRRALLVTLTLGTTYIVFWSARQIQMDLLVTATTWGAVLAIVSVVDRGLRPAAGWGLAGVCIGLGLLAKGPVGLLLPLIVALPYVASRGKARLLADRAVLWGLLAAATVAGPWYVALALSPEPGVLYELLVRQTFGRFVSPWDHQAPWWYYGGQFWIDMAPWALFLPLAIGLRGDDPDERRLHRLAWISIVVLVTFFSLSGSKRSPYILPVAPGVAILVAGMAARWSRGCLSPMRSAAGRVLLLAYALVFLGGAYWLHSRGVAALGLEELFHTPVRLAVVVLGLGGGAILLGTVLGRRRGYLGFVALLSFVAVLQVAAAGWILPSLDARKSHRGFCEQLVAEVADDAPLRGYRLWKWRASYSYYSKRNVGNLESPERLAEYWGSPGQVFLIVERGMLDEARTVIGGRAPIFGREVGDNAAFVFTNRAAELEPAREQN